MSVGGPLVVPVHLDALCLTDDLDVRGPDNAFSRLPYRDAATGPDHHEDLPYVSEIMARTRFQDEDFRLKAGVHLPWALPDGLTRMVQRADGTTAVPAVPNRWLVTRSRDGRVEGEWVVESDYLSDDNPAAILYPVPGADRPHKRLGRKPPLDVWSRSTDRSRYLPELTAVGYGEPNFAARYANCHSVFGFLDPDYPGATPKGLRYEVLGWFDDHGQDPAAALGDGSAAPDGQSWQEAARLRFGWTASSAGLDQEWIRHLLDGAFSIGRLTAADAELDRAGSPMHSAAGDDQGADPIRCRVRLTRAGRRGVRRGSRQSAGRGRDDPSHPGHHALPLRRHTDPAGRPTAARGDALRGGTPPCRRTVRQVTAQRRRDRRPGSGVAAPGPRRPAAHRRPHQEHRRDAACRDARLRRFRAAEDRDGRAGELSQLLPPSVAVRPSPPPAVPVAPRPDAS
ncbi:hypothetical protein [Streptomyces sp. NRRL WC-3618]|uniref:hypothetical protein n=1 Tax=Streptomyces sp. NRRL WC-3618 TaxID=1519490 RepID=UPI00131B9DF6|nr:hypothetical protein [Streptomyces sp. NRRL WC-3618]